MLKENRKARKLNWLQRYVRRADPMEAFLLTFAVAWVAIMGILGVIIYVGMDQGWF